jgi:hypothetical protein
MAIFGGQYNVETQRQRNRLNQVWDREGCFWKTSDQTIINNTTLQNITELSLYPIKPFEKINFKYVVWYCANISSNIRFAITTPASCNVYYAPTGSIQYSTTGTFVQVQTANASACTINFAGLGANYVPTAPRANSLLAEIIGSVEVGATGGFLNIQFSQVSSMASANAAILKNSHLIITT